MANRMTAREWQSCRNPHQMIRCLQDKCDRDGTETSERKMRLMACAFCRGIWHLMPDDLSRATVELCECYADGLADPQPLFERGGFFSNSGSEELDDRFVYSAHTVECEAYLAALFVGYRMEVYTGFNPHSAPVGAAIFSSGCSLRAIALSGASVAKETKGHCAIIRDIIGNPFRPLAVEQSWLTSTVAALAQEMYFSRDFSAMPVMADALQDAGCENKVVLKHCRQPGEHVRGCWVVDLLTGRK